MSWWKRGMITTPDNPKNYPHHWTCKCDPCRENSIHDLSGEGQPSKGNVHHQNIVHLGDRVNETKQFILFIYFICLFHHFIHYLFGYNFIIFV